MDKEALLIILPVYVNSLTYPIGWLLDLWFSSVPPSLLFWLHSSVPILFFQLAQCHRSCCVSVVFQFFVGLFLILSFFSIISKQSLSVGRSSVVVFFSFLKDHSIFFYFCVSTSNKTNRLSCSVYRESWYPFLDAVSVISACFSMWYFLLLLTHILTFPPLKHTALGCRMVLH